MDSDDVQFVLDKANELLEAGKPSESLDCLTELEDRLIETADRIEWASLKAWALSELNDTIGALNVLGPMLEEHPDSARLHSTLGVVLSNEGDLDGACDALQQAVELDEEDEVSLANLGLVYEKLRQYEEALETYERAIEMGAEIDWLLRRKAAVQVELGQNADARGTLKRYLSLVPDDVDHWISLAILCSDDLDFDEAFRCYRIAEQIRPDLPALRLNWGVTGVRAHRQDVARQQLKYLSRLEPQSARPLLLEAFIQEEDGRLQDAIRSYGDALERVRRDDLDELAYALEMAMDFFSRHGLLGPCEQLFDQAYMANVCSVELCEAYREIAGDPVPKANWYSLIVESDYRPGLVEIVDAHDKHPARERFLRNFQVIARDHDEAMAIVMDLGRRMKESNMIVREFAGTEEVEDTHTGVYEVERESLVIANY